MRMNNVTQFVYNCNVVIVCEFTSVCAELYEQCAALKPRTFRIILVLAYMRSIKYFNVLYSSVPCTLSCLLLLTS